MQIALRCSFIAALSLMLSARAATVSLVPDKDNSIYQDAENSNGVGIHLFSGNTGFVGPRRALLRFDVGAAIPGGSTIISVRLQLTCTLSPSGVVDVQTFQLHELSAEWGEGSSNAGEPGGTGAPATTGDATWTQRHFAMSAPWTTPGGDFDSAASGSATAGTCVPPTLVTFASTPQLVADVQAWLDDPCANFGWILIGNEAASPTARRFESREASPAQAPALVIDYVAPSSGAGAVPDGDEVAGNPMTVGKASGGQLLLDWSASCRPDDDYAVYEGEIGRFYSHAPVVCSTGGDTSALVLPGFGRAYYLVVPIEGSFEGSYGTRSNGEERPPLCGACRPRALSSPVCP